MFHIYPNKIFVSIGFFFLVDHKLDTQEILLQSSTFEGTDVLWRTTAADVKEWYSKDDAELVRRGSRQAAKPYTDIHIEMINHVHPENTNNNDSNDSNDSKESSKNNSNEIIVRAVSHLPSKSTTRMRESTIDSYDHSHLHLMEDSRRLAFELDWATAKWEHVGVALKSVSPLMLATWREIGIKWNIAAASVEQFSARMWASFVPGRALSGMLLQQWCDDRDKALQRGGDLYDVGVFDLAGFAVSPTVGEDASNASSSISRFDPRVLNGKSTGRVREGHQIIGIDSRSVENLSHTKIQTMLKNCMKQKRPRDTINLRLRDTHWRPRAPGSRYVVTLPLGFHALGVCWGHSDQHLGRHSLHGFTFVISPAKHAGMAVGDRLLSVNDVNLTGVDFQVMCQRVAQSSQSPVSKI